jgi:ATP synthase protein I
MEEARKPKSSEFQGLKWLGLAWILVITILGGGLLGWLLDRWLGTLPIFMIVGILLGVVSGFWRTYKSVMKSIEDE